MKTGQRVILISILASFVAFLDGSVVNVALPAIVHELGGGLALQQWVVDIYLITLGALMLLAGSLSDLLGRRRIMAIGLIGFAVTSILCAIAPTGGFLVVGRALQGIAGALLVPSSLALIVSTFSGKEQGKAIGTWTAWTGIAFVVGPLLGGFLIQTATWRYIFAINVIPIAVTLLLMRGLTVKDDIDGRAKIDLRGAWLCALGLGGTVYALIEQSHYGWSSPMIYIPAIMGAAALVWFVRYEQRCAAPMLPMSLFKNHNFSFGNLATAAIYGGLSVATFLVAIFVQQVGGYTALEAGMALLPVTLIMFVLSSRFGALASTHGPRLFMTCGPIIGAIGFLYMLRVDEAVRYWTQLFPGIVLFGIGLSITIAPLTAAILGSIAPRQAGIASAVNNAVARIAGLIAIAAIGLVIGDKLTIGGFHRGLIATAVALGIGGVISWVGIQNDTSKEVNASQK